MFLFVCFFPLLILTPRGQLTPSAVVLTLFANGLVGHFDATSALEQPMRTKLATRSGKSLNIATAAFSCDGSFVAVGAGDKLYVFDTLRGTELAVCAIDAGVKLRCLAWSLDASVLAAGCGDTACRVFSFVPQRALLTVTHTMRRPHTEDVVVVAISPDNRFVATGSKDRHARVFEVSVRFFLLSR